MILHKARQIFSIIRQVFMPVMLLALPASASAQHEPLSADDRFWSGLWQAEADGMRFTVRITSEGDRFEVEEVEPRGMGWRTSNGIISGDSATVDVSYQGVSAKVLIQVRYPDSAIVRPLSCQPDYHIVCTLVRNQQARFQRQE